MIRVAKDPVIRKTELIDIAERLFIENGYDETAVSDIVKEAKVAQGTFYYYFRSKDEILDAILDRYVDRINVLLDAIVKDESLNAVEKVIRTFRASQEFRQKQNGMETLIDYVHEERNEVLHYRIEKKNTPIFVDFFEKIIQQGIHEGHFKIEHPHETAQALMATATIIGHGAREGDIKTEEIMRLVYASLDIWERLLGAKRGSFAEIMELVEGGK